MCDRRTAGREYLQGTDRVSLYKTKACKQSTLIHDKYEYSKIRALWTQDPLEAWYRKGAWVKRARDAPGRTSPQDLQTATQIR